MDDRDVYEIDFNLGPANQRIDYLLDRLEDAEQRIGRIFGNIETVVVGSSNKAVSELARLSREVNKFLDETAKKTRGRKPIIIVEDKDVKAAKDNLKKMEDAVTELAEKVDEEATQIADDIKNAFRPPPTIVNDTDILPSPTQVGTPPPVNTTQRFAGGINARDDTEFYPGATEVTPRTPLPAPPSRLSPQDEKALRDEAKAAEAAERALIRLLAAELKAAAGADNVTRSYIESAAATAKNAQAYVEQVAAIAKVGTAQEKLTQDQIDYAVEVTNTKREISALNKEIQDQAAAYNAARARLEENITVQRNTAEGPGREQAQRATTESFQAFEREKEARDELIEKIDFQVAKLRYLNDEREKGAAAAQKQVELEKLGEEAKAGAAANVAKQKRAEFIQEQQLQKQREQAASQFVRIARSMSSESTALNQLAQRYGIYSVTLRKAGEATNALEKEFYDIIRQSPQLQRVFDQLTDSVEEFTVKGDPSTFRSAQGFFLDPNDIRQLGFAFQRFGVTGVAAFGEIYAAIGPAGIAVGAVTIGVVSLTRALISMGRAGVEAFKKILAESISLSRQRETTAAQFEAYLESAELARQALNEVDRLSEQLGQDVSPIAQSFLPLVGSVEELRLFAQVAASLALSKPNKTISDANTALREFSGGDITSLRKLFEIPSWVLDEAKQAVDTTGDLADGMRVLNEYLVSTGKSVEALGDTFDFGLGRAQEFANTLGRDFGRDIVSTLGDSLDRLLEKVTSKEAMLRGFAYGAGSLISEVLDSIIGMGERLLDTLTDEDFFDALSRLERIADSISATTDAASDLNDSLGGFLSVSQNMTVLANDIERVATSIALAANLTAIWGSQMKFMIEYAAVLGNAFVAIQRGMPLSLDGVLDRLDQIASDTDQRNREIMERIGGLLVQFGSAGAPSGGYPQNVQDYVDSFSDDDTSALDAALAARHEEQMEEMSQAVQEYIDDIKELQDDIRSKTLDLAVKYNDEVLDFLEEVEQKRYELLLKRKQDLEDLEDEFNRKLRDIRQDAADDQEDRDIENSREKLRLEREYVDKRLEIEEEYQRKIAEIRRKYAFDLEEAARQNDAVAYLRLLRKREFDLNEARIDRDESLADVDDDESKKKDEAARKRREDEEDAKRSYSRKLRDLQTWLDDEQEELAKNYKRDLEAQARHEEEKRKEIAKSYERDIRDLRIHYDERLAELREKYAEEFDLVAMWEQRIADMQAEIRSSVGVSGIGIGKRRPGDGSGNRGLGDSAAVPGDTQSSRGSRNGGDTQSTHSRDWYEREVRRLAQQYGRNDILNFVGLMSLAQLMNVYAALSRVASAPSRDSGGHVRQGEPVIVGQNRQPEVFVPASAGYITPMSQLYRQPIPAAASNYQYNNRTVKVDLSMLDTTLLDRSIAGIVKIQLGNMLKEALDV